MENNSITIFDYNEIREYDGEHFKDVKDDMILKILIVRGIDKLNPTLRYGALKILKQINGESTRDMRDMMDTRDSREVNNEGEFKKVEYRKTNKYYKSKSNDRPPNDDRSYRSNYNRSNERQYNRTYEREYRPSNRTYEREDRPNYRTYEREDRPNYRTYEREDNRTYETEDRPTYGSINRYSSRTYDETLDKQEERQGDASTLVGVPKGLQQEERQEERQEKQENIQEERPDGDTQEKMTSNNKEGYTETDGILFKNTIRSNENTKQKKNNY